MKFGKKVAIVWWSLLMFTVGFFIGGMVGGDLSVAEHDALREEVAELDSLGMELVVALSECNDILKVFIPPDTTKKFVRPRDISGLDTMPLITSCSMYIVTTPRMDTRSEWLAYFQDRKQDQTKESK